MPDVIVIGGGPAGSVAALLLARAGWQVTLVEQHRFPRDKVCGECLSALGAEVLRRVGLFDPLVSGGAVRLERTLLHAPTGACAAARLRRPMWGVSRVVLDGLLLDAAVAAGARLLQPARCESVIAGPRPAVRVRGLVANEVRTLQGDVVLVADGKSALLGAGPPPPTGDLGIKAHFTRVDGPRDSVELFGLDGCYGGLAPIEGDRWNAALSVPAVRVRRHMGRLDHVVSELVAENVTLRRRMAGAVRVGNWMAAPLPRFPVRRKWPQGVVPLGNAAAAMEPIGGEGMGAAMRSAEVVVDALLAHRGVGQVYRSYHALWRTRRFACRASALVASSPRCSSALAPVLRTAPVMLRPALALMGK